MLVTRLKRFVVIAMLLALVAGLPLRGAYMVSAEADAVSAPAGDGIADVARDCCGEPTVLETVCPASCAAFVAVLASRPAPEVAPPRVRAVTEVEKTTGLLRQPEPHPPRIS